MGSTWVHLRMCMTCGRSAAATPPRTATPAPAQMRLTQSPGPPKRGEDWSWCYVDEVAFIVSPEPAET